MKPTEKPQTSEQDDVLNAFFTAAREAEPGPSPDLLARILSDGEAEQAALSEQALQEERLQRVEPRWTSLLWASIGGWTGAGGLVTAAAAGLWIGISPPVLLEGVTATFALQSPTVFDATDLLSADFAADL
ncbi:MAG: hypothetical protein AAFY03_04245 [Pseudomonadota bacterium]